MLELDLQKVTTFVSRPFRLTQGDKGYIQPFHLSVGFAPYSATADTLCFAGTKPDGQIIEVEAEPSRFSKDGDTWFFSLPDEVAQAIGTFEAYFYVKKGNSVVASTTKFAYEVGAKFGDDEASNSYVSVFNSLRDKFNQIIESSRTELNNWTNLNNQARADLDKLLKDLKTQTDNWLSAKSSEIQGIITNYNNKYNELVGKWNNQITTQQNDYAAQKAKIDSEYKQQLENLKSQLNSEWQTQKQAQQASFDSFKADLTNRISQAKSDIDSIQAIIPTLQKKIAEISLNSFSKNDAQIEISKGIADITGNLIDPNLNDWVKNDAASKANIKINYQDGTNDISFTGVENSEVLDFKFNTKQNTDYILTFTYTPDDIHTVKSNCLFLALWYEDLTKYYGQWSTNYNPKANNQVIRVPAQQGGNYSLKFNSQNLTEMHIGISFDNFIDGQTSKFKISNLVVRETNSTLVGLTDTISSLQSKYFPVQDLSANTNVDNLSQTGLYNLRGQAGITGLPQSGNIWGTLLVFNNNNGSNGIQMYLNSNDDYFFYREWNKSKGFVERRPWKKLSTSDDLVNYYNKAEIDNKFKSIVLNIIDFGAKAEDSNFDNAPAFNRAIQSLPATGGIIYIPNGNFFLKSTVTIDRSYVHIMGLNHGLRSGIDPSDGTTQTGGGGAKVTVQNSISAFKIQNTHNDKRLSGITFSGFDLKGDTNGGVGIDGVSNTDRVVIDNMTINNIGTGVKLNGADAPRITNSWIAETKSSIQLTGASQQAEIKNNSLGAQPQGVTILLENADRYNITGNNIYPDGSSAIRLLNPVHGAIVGNTISAFYTGIIEMLPSGSMYGNSNVISGNVIAIETWKNNPIGRDNKWGIIHIEGYNNLIAGNNILSNGSPQNTTGVLIMNGDSNKIASNVINIPNTDSNVVCNGGTNNNSVIFSTKGNSFQNGLNSSNINIDVDSYTALQNRCESLETNLAVLQSKINNLLTLVAVSNDTVSIQGSLEIHGGQIRNYWGGVDQYVAYSPSGVKRGYFGVWDNGTFNARGN